MHGVELHVVEQPRAAADPGDVRLPGGDRVVLVEADAELDQLPQPLDVGLAEHLLRPTRVRDADHRPVVQLLVDLAVVLLGQLQHARTPDALARQVGEQVRLGVARQRDDGGALVADLLRPLEQPRRSPGEDVVGRTLDQRAPEMLVGVEDVDVARARPVGGAGDRAGHLGVLDAPEHLDELPRLDVRAHPHGELGVPLDPVQSCHSSLRRMGTASPSAVRPSTSSSGPPTMKSVCTVEMFMPSPGSPSKVSGIPKP